MKEKITDILQITAGTTQGGASRIAVNLYEALKKYNFTSQLATGGQIPAGKEYLYIHKKAFSYPKNKWAKTFYNLAKRTYKLTGIIKGAGRLTNILYNIGTPSCLFKTLRGIENFEGYPGTWEFFKTLQPFPNIIHAHNLHGSYFDLRILPWLSHKAPLVITLHDEWMYTGHCACTLGCEKWRKNCGNCPDLTTYPSLWRDTTTYNIKQKQKIYAKSNLHVVTPSQWLMNKAQNSILAHGIKSSQVIYNGIDLAVFKPGDKHSARETLDLPRDAHILLFAAYKAKTNKFKDYPTLEKAIKIITSKQKLTRPLLAICLGEKSETLYFDNAQIRFIEYVHGLDKLIAYYCASDIFVHATQADNFPTTILEAFACGTPVIGTNIGGIPEQIDDGTTGLLYEKNNAQELANALQLLLNNPALCHNFAANALEKTRKLFTIEKQIEKHIELYNSLLENKKESTFHENLLRL